MLTFGWLSPLLHLSYKRTLKQGDMVGIPPNLTSEMIYSRFEMFWNKEKQKQWFLLLFQLIFNAF